MYEVPLPTMDEYLIWARDELGVDFQSEECQENYAHNVTNVLAAVTNVFDKRLGLFLEKCNAQYGRNKKTDLFMTSSQSDVKWLVKEYTSVLDKAYRYNVVENTRWSSSPDEGWMTPENLFLRLNDIVRTRIVCKYIDGPKLLAERLSDFCNDLGLESRFSSRQRDDGYYAYHFYVRVPVSLVRMGAGLVKVKVDAEIQITTQLQEALYQITHPYYEARRTKRETDPSSWKWEVHTNRFRVGYLSHALHLLEAVILEARNERLKALRK